MNKSVHFHWLTIVLLGALFSWDYVERFGREKNIDESPQITAADLQFKVQKNTDIALIKSRYSQMLSDNGPAPDNETGNTAQNDQSVHRLGNLQLRLLGTILNKANESKSFALVEVFDLKNDQTEVVKIDKHYRLEEYMPTNIGLYSLTLKHLQSGKAVELRLRSHSP